MSLFTQIHDYLLNHPGTAVRDMLHLGHEKKQVNSMLYANKSHFKMSAGQPPLWSAIKGARLPDDEQYVVSIVRDHPGLSARELLQYTDFTTTKELNPILYRLASRKIVECNKDTTTPTWR